MGHGPGGHGTRVVGFIHGSLAIARYDVLNMSASPALWERNEIDGVRERALALSLGILVPKANSTGKGFCSSPIRGEAGTMLHADADD